MNDTAHAGDLDVHSIVARLDALQRDVSALVAKQKKTDELFAEMAPILKQVMATATTRLDELDRKGYFAFGRELVKVGQRIVEGFSPDDVRQLGDAVVGILETVRAVTQPEVLQIASEAGEVLQKADEAEPVGLLGAVRATRDDDVQKGMAVMMEVMRHVGRAATKVKAHRDTRPEAKRREKLAAMLGPRRQREKPASAPTVSAPVAAKPVTPRAARATPTAASSIDGVALGADGHLVDPKQWTEPLATKLAASLGVTLDEPRWALVRFARAEFEAKGTSPNIRRITQGAQVETKDVYALFPKAPGRTIAKIAGIPKPVGCI